MFYLEKFQKINVYHLENFFIFIIKEKSRRRFFESGKTSRCESRDFSHEEKNVPRFFTLLYYKNNLLSNKITTGLVSCSRKFKTKWGGLCAKQKWNCGLEKSKMKLRPYVLLSRVNKEKRASRIGDSFSSTLGTVRWIRPRYRSCASSRPCPVQSHPS